MKLNILDLGRCDYRRALDIQYEILGKVQSGDMDDTLIISRTSTSYNSGEKCNREQCVV